MEVRSTMMGRIQNWTKANPRKTFVGASVAAHAAATAALSYHYAIDLAATYGAVAIPVSLTLFALSKVVYEAVRPNNFISPGLNEQILKRVDRVKTDLKREAKTALAQFGETGRSEINWGKFIPKAELNNELTARLAGGRSLSPFEARESRGWQDQLEDYARKIDAALKSVPADPIKRFQKAFDLFSRSYALGYRGLQGALYRRLEGRGGNCEAQAKLFLALIDRVFDWSKTDWRPAAAYYTDHIELVLFNKTTKNIYDPTTRKIMREAPTAIYDPHIFAGGYLGGAGEKFELPKNLLLAEPETDKSGDLFSAFVNKLTVSVLKLFQARNGGFKYDFTMNSCRTSKADFLTNIFSRLTGVPILGRLLSLAIALARIPLMPFEYLLNRLPKIVRTFSTLASLVIFFKFIQAIFNWSGAPANNGRVDDQTEVRGATTLAGKNEGKKTKCGMSFEPVRTIEEANALIEKLRVVPSGLAAAEEIGDYFESSMKIVWRLARFRIDNPNIKQSKLSRDEYERVLDLFLTPASTRRAMEMLKAGRYLCPTDYEFWQAVPGPALNFFEAVNVAEYSHFAGYKTIALTPMNEFAVGNTELFLNGLDIKVLRAERIILNREQEKRQNPGVDNVGPIEFEIDLPAVPMEGKAETTVFEIDSEFYLKELLLRRPNFSMTLIDKLSEEDARYVKEQLRQIIGETGIRPIQFDSYLYTAADFLTPLSKANQPLRDFIQGIRGEKGELMRFYLFAFYADELFRAGLEFKNGTFVAPSAALIDKNLTKYDGLDARDPLLREAKEIYIKLAGEPKPPKKGH